LNTRIRIDTHEEQVMKSKLKSWPSVLAVAGLIVGLSIVPQPGAFAAGQQADVFPPEENVFGLSYGDWSAAWWQYVLSIPADTNPIFDTTGANCDIEQGKSPVFFLVGAGAEPVTRTCTVPSGRALFFPIINVECSNVEPPPFFGETAQELRECAAELVNGVGVETLQVVVDGKQVQNLEDFRVQSPLFDFILPPGDNFLGLPDVTSGSAVSDGYWLMLKPLSPGNHVIHWEGAFVSGPGAGFSQNVTYNLIVK
jgi:hypothetical protein